MSFPRTRLVASLLATLLAGCGISAPDAAPATPNLASANRLSLRIDGQAWVADHDLFGAVHPAGYDRALLVAGSRGPKDENEQVFNLNLFGIDGPGRYTITRGGKDGSAAQLANLSAERFLIGGLMFEQRLEVEVVRMQAAPVDIEVRFHGELQANDGAMLKVEDGEFRYRE